MEIHTNRLGFAFAFAFALCPLPFCYHFRFAYLVVCKWVKVLGHT